MRKVTLLRFERDPKAIKINILEPFRGEICPVL